MSWVGWWRHIAHFIQRTKKEKTPVLRESRPFVSRRSSQRPLVVNTVSYGRYYVCPSFYEWCCSVTEELALNQARSYMHVVDVHWHELPSSPYPITRTECVGDKISLAYFPFSWLEMACSGDIFSISNRSPLIPNVCARSSFFSSFFSLSNSAIYKMWCFVCLVVLSSYIVLWSAASRDVCVSMFCYLGFGSSVMLVGVLEK